MANIGLIALKLRPIHYLAIGFASVLALLVILLQFSLSRLDDLSLALNHITHEKVTKNRLIGDMLEGIRLRQISLRNMLLMPDPFDREEESLRFYSYAVPIAESRNKLASLNLSNDERNRLGRISGLMRIAYPIQNELVDAGVWDKKIKGLGTKLEAAITAQGAVVAELKKLKKVHEQQSNKTILNTETMAREARNLVRSIGVSAFLLGGFIAIAVIKIVRKQETVIETAVGELHHANHHLETANERLEQKVGERTRDLSIAKDNALSLNRTKSQFLANMSHELRTPLNAIIGYTEMLQEEVSGPEASRILNDLENVHAAAKQLLRLIDQVLDLSKIESGKFEISPGELNLSPFLDKIYRIALPSITANSNHLSINYADNLGKMVVDSMRLRQILLNLLSNAGKFTSNGDISLTVSRQTRRHVDWIKFSVKDTGIGIDPEHFDKIFQEFIQADASTTRDYGGTGLGLAICQQLCLLMGGYISVDSSPREGATFTVCLPVNNNQSGIAVAS